ncbi:MAG TPA: FtsQ-type POTRA domain-containing protein [Longimicrobiales bacterium]
MRRGVPRRAVALLAAVAVVALITQAPVLLRRLDAFRVERVEVLGTRHLAPHTALAASGITRTSSVFDDPGPWREALLRHPLVAEATIERKLPSTLIVRIVEVEPVALVRTPELRPVDAGGRLLPIDPAGIALDLPIVDVPADAAADGAIDSEIALALIDVAVRLGAAAPSLAARVSEVAPAPGGTVRLFLRDPPGAEVWLPTELEAKRLEQLRLTIADLERRQEMAAVRRIDLRFRDQVVVSLTPIANG